MQFTELESKVHENAQRLQKLVRDGSGFGEVVKRSVRREAEDLKEGIQAESAKLARRIEAVSPKTVVISGLITSIVGGGIGLGGKIYDLSSTNLFMYKTAFVSSYFLVNFGAFMTILGVKGIVMEKQDLNEKKQKS